jgi:phage terminase large subunit GpA-like protein
VNLRDGYAEACAAVAAAWALPARLTVSEWADRHRVLTAKASSEPGPWRTARTPYLREIMDVLSAHHPATDVVFMAASQVGKSEVGNNWVGYTIDHDPGPMLFVEPTIDMAEKYSKQRLAPMIEMSEVLRERIPPARKRDSGNQTLQKDFPGGVLMLAGANSASGLSSMPIKKLLLDEVDRYPPDVDDEGDPIDLAEQRTVTFPRAKRYKASTPGRLAMSHIAKEYETSSRGQLWLPCPHCHEKQVLVRENLRWSKTTDPATGKRVHQPHTARYVCEHCGVEIEERHKTWMLERGEWRHRNPERKKLGYQLSALYTPIGLGRSWAKVAEEWLEASRDPAKLQTFVNLIDGLPYEDHSDRLRGAVIGERAEAWPARTLPAGYVVLTLGVDVQDDRLALLLVAWAEGERSAVIDHLELPGDPIKQDVWDALTEYRRRPVRNAAGMDLRISMTAIDSGGHRTQAVYGYGRLHRYDNVIVTKGSSTLGRPVLGKPTKQDVKNAKGELLRAGVNLWMVGTDTAKDALFARLEADGGLEPASRMVRFADGFADEFYEQLVAEVRDDRTGRYVKLRQRNEALDCMVEAMAAAHHPRVRVHRMQAADWQHLRSIVEPANGDLFAGAGDAAAPAAGSPPAREAPETPESAAEGHAGAHDAGWVPERTDWL